MWWKYVGYLALVAAVFGAGFRSEHYLLTNKYERQIAELNKQQSDKEAAWQTMKADLERQRADAEAQARAVEQKRNHDVQEAANANTKRVKDLTRTNVGLTGRLRSALKKACGVSAPTATGSVPGHPATSGGDAGAAYSDGLRDGIAEGLERRIVNPANAQTARLQWCQDYVHSLQVK